MNRKKFILIFSSLLIFLIQISSQVPFIGKEIGSEFNRGMELFNKEKYPAAIRLLDSYIKSDDKSKSYKYLPMQNITVQLLQLNYSILMLNTGW